MVTVRDKDLDSCSSEEFSSESEGKYKRSDRDKLSLSFLSFCTRPRKSS